MPLSRPQPLASSEATEALGARFARTLPAPGDAPLVVFLQGELGAGKTTFARGMLRALGVTGTVRSPSYTLVEQYPLATRLALHLDLYRLVDEIEFEQLGTRDFFLPGALWLVEWPERAPRSLPAADLVLQFGIRGVGHEVSAVAPSVTGLHWLASTIPDSE